jgi:hypothetical protein
MSNEIEKILIKLNNKLQDYNDSKSSKEFELMSHFTYVTNYYYEVIMFGDEILWSSEDDLREYVDEDGMEQEDLGLFVEKAFNKYVNSLKKLRFDTPVDEKVGGFEVASELIEELTSRKGFDGIWNSMDDEVRDEMFQKWVNIVEKYN